MRIERVGKPNAAPAPAPVRVAAPSEGQQAFNESANEALARQIEEELFSGGSGGGNAGLPPEEKAALSSIDDIAARASLNIVDGTRKNPQPGHE